METKKKEQNTKAEAETFAATVKGMQRLAPRPKPVRNLSLGGAGFAWR